MNRKVKYLDGDLLAAGLPAWGHGVNLEGVMGSGIARQVRAEYPEVFEKYVEACKSKELMPGGAQVVIANDGTAVYNLASQIKQGPSANLQLLSMSVVTALMDVVERKIDRFGLPRIGSGIGGLKWDLVNEKLETIQNMFPEVQMEVYTL